MLRVDLSRIKKAACAVLILAVSAMASVPGHAADDDILYFGESEDSVAQNVNSTVVTKGEFYITGAVPGTISYSGNQMVWCDISEGTVYFKEFLVNMGDTVKKGDPICEIRVEVDEIEKEEIELNLEAAERNLEDYITDTKILLEQYKAASTQGSEKDRKLATLSYERLLKTFNEEVEKRESRIDEYTLRLDEIENLSKTKYIKAPTDGVVGYTNRFRPGSSIGRWDFICMINDASDIRVIVEGGSDLLRYNMPVKVVQTNNGRSVELTGKVMTMKSTVLSVNLMAHNDVIEVYGDTTQFRPGSEVSIRFDKVYVPDALLVNKNAVKNDSKGTYVNVFVDGIVSKRYVVVGAADSTKSWIASGVEEGDIIILE